MIEDENEAKQLLAENRIRLVAAEKKAVPLLRREVSPWSLMVVAIFVFGAGTYMAVDLSLTFRNSFQGTVEEETMGQNQDALSGGVLH